MATILSYAGRGETATLEQIAEKLNNETTWVKSVEIIRGETTSGDSIIVTLLDGKVYQIYYDSLYGAVNISHVGETNGGETQEEIIAQIPKVQADLDGNGGIEVKIELERGKLSEVQLIYGENILETKQITGNSAEVTFEDVEKNGGGWYQVNAVTNTGKSGTAWVRIVTTSDKVPLPKVKIEPERPDGENNWYVTPVTVTGISTSSVVTKMHYTISTTGEAEPVEGKEVVLPTFNETGTYAAVVWAEDASGNTSGGVVQNIKVDLNAPVIESVEVTKGDKASSDNEWYTSDVEITVKANDNGGGKLAGYEYEVLDYNDNSKVIKEIDGVHDISETISIKTDGEYVINVKAVDEAGNRSGTEPITIKKDSVKPRVTLNSVTSATKTGFTVKVTAGDDLSQIQRLEVRTSTGTIAKTVYEVSDIVVNTLSAGTTYTVFVRAYDNAGLYQDSDSTSITTLAARIYLYNLGDTCSSLTGGWEGKSISSTHAFNSSLTFNSDSMYYVQNSNNSAAVTTKKKVTIPSSNYSTLVCVMKLSSSAKTEAHIASALPFYDHANNVALCDYHSLGLKSAGTTKATLSWNVSAYSGGDWLVQVRGYGSRSRDLCLSSLF